MKLKTKLILLNGLVSLFIGAMLFLQFRAAQNKQKLEIRKGFMQSSEKLQRAVSNVFYLYYHNVQNIALNDSLKNKSAADANFYFNELVSLYPLYDMILFTDLEGKYIASNDLDSSGNKLAIDKAKSFDFKNEKWFQALKSEKLTEDYKKKIYGSYFGDFENSKLVSDVYGKERFGNHFSVKVTDLYGEPIGYLTTFLNEKWIENELMATNNALEKEGKKGAEVYITNKKGLVVSEFKDNQIVKEDFLKVNADDKFKKFLDDSSNKMDVSFVESMFLIDNEPLFAFSEFDNEKFVNAIGWKAFVKMDSKDAFSAINVAENIFTISLVFILIAGALVAVVISNRLSDRLLQIANTVANGSLDITNAASQLSEYSKTLSSATSDQASSLQQTVASLNEISAMVTKNTDASQNSKDLSGRSRKAAETGKGTINNMLKSIDDISEANSDIIGQMNQNTQEIQEIITVIREIEEKTKVINDIVFQTKLLSFNASVEAARAGEHGKGFSVVAEEVGNLAQHSGDAAKEIEEMLVQSVTKVESIAKKTEVKVKDLVSKGTERVENGKSVARQCDTALQEILDLSANLDGMIEEIAVASIEQSQGIQEISKAMTELDKVTKQNSLIAQETNNHTQGLNTQASNLKDVSETMTNIITGGKVADLSFSALDKKSSADLGEKEKVKKDVKVTSKKEETPKAKNILSFKKKDKPAKDQPKKVVEDKKVEAKEEAVVEKAQPVEEKKVASSDISVPIADDGEWEDI